MCVTIKLSGDCGEGATSGFDVNDARIGELAPLHDGANGSSCKSIWDEIVPVNVFTGKSNKDFAGLHRPRIDSYSRDRILNVGKMDLTHATSQFSLALVETSAGYS